MAMICDSSDWPLGLVVRMEAYAVIWVLINPDANSSMRWQHLVIGSEGCLVCYCIVQADLLPSSRYIGTLFRHAIPNSQPRPSFGTLYFGISLR